MHRDPLSAPAGSTPPTRRSRRTLRLTLAARRRLLTVTLIATVAAAGVTGVVLFGVFSPADPVPEAGAAGASPGCAVLSEPVGVIAPAGAHTLLREAAEHRCIDLTLHRPAGLSELGAQLGSGIAQGWVAESTEQAGALGVEPGRAAELAISPIVFSAPPAVAPLLAGSEWIGVLAAGLPEGVAVSLPASAESGVAAQVAAQIARVAGAPEGAGTAELGAILERLVSSPDSAVTITVDELHALERADVTIPPGGLASLDYSSLVLAPASPTQAALLDTLFTEARDTPAPRLEELGLLPAGSTSYADTPLLPRVEAASYFAVSALVDPDMLAANLLILLDVSGSMGERAEGQMSGVEAMRASIDVVATTMPDNLFVEWRQFGYRIGGDSDMVTMSSGLLRDSREELRAGSDKLTAQPVGTPLYQAVVDGVADARLLGDTTHAPVLVVVTDGRDEFAPDRINLPDALATLAETADPLRPVQTLFLGFGDADLSEMEQVVAVTGGHAWKINGPEELAGTILRSITWLGSEQLHASARAALG
ncbi:vWA domain-containing protein [Mycetocola spongiae]|uniref:hypothetical protein n=1 Tax=Mycetocola spongiae TaxID=2859226 RepID=UPI001CF0ECAF|nr:hypothetical protein [Mycetocola spongiae]UCR89103.1 hypothetical protein KXZ72_14395 [Mycetocola spongiae]